MTNAWNDDQEFVALRQDFLEDLHRRTHEIRDLLNQTPILSTRILIAKIHSFKGAASSFRLRTLTTALHQLEDQILNVQTLTPDYLKNIILLMELIDSYADAESLALQDETTKTTAKSIRDQLASYWTTPPDRSHYEDKTGSIAQPSPPRPDTNRKQLKDIVYVDDDPDIIAFAKVFFKRQANLHPVFFTTAKDALAYLMTHPCDLVISDLQMLEIDGLAFRKLLLDHPHTQHLPIIFVTGEEKKTLPDAQQFDRGVLGVLNKTRGFQKLIPAIEVLWSQKIGPL